jgi:hypothetical protein
VNGHDSQLTATLAARLNGPHSDEATAEAAGLVSETTRLLNYATGPHADDGLTEPGTAYRVMADLAEAARRLPQLCGQLGDYLAREFAAGHLADDYGRLPYLVTSQARHDLDAAAQHAAALGTALAAAQNAIAGLHLAERGEDQ